MLRRWVFKSVLVIGGLLNYSCSGCGSDPPPNVSSSVSEVSGCACYNRINPNTGAVGRLFAAGEGYILYEDPGTGDVYHWNGPPSGGWQRMGGSARTYAAVVDQYGADNLYRLSGDARIDEKPGGVSADEFSASGPWQRVFNTAVSRDLFSSTNNLYAFGPTGILTSQGPQYALTANPTTTFSVSIDLLSTSASEIAATSYVADSTGNATIYRNGSSATYLYANHCSTTTNRSCSTSAPTGCPSGETCVGAGWSEIGSTPATSIYAAAGTVFARNTSGAILEYLGTPFSWSTPSGATGITKVAGTATVAYALAQNTLYQLSGGTWTPVAGITSVADIAADPAYLYALRTDGSILQLNAGTWNDISCQGATVTAGCFGTGPNGAGCEPGPTPTSTAPSYNDTAWTTQQNTTNAKYDVLTQHNDNSRSGAALNEDILTPTSLSTNNFGWLGSVRVPGKIYAQPLFVQQAAVVCTDPSHTPGLQNANIAYVATLENDVVAIDVNAMNICWTTPALGCPQPTRAGDAYTGCGNANADGACSQNFDMYSANGHREGGTPGVRIGIVSTPVIDPIKSVMYVMTRARDGEDTRGRYFLNVINTRTGELISKVEAIADTLNGHNGCGGHALHPSQGTNRVGLLLNNNVVYAGFSGNSGELNANGVDYHGAVLGFDVTDPAHPQNLQSSFCATPSSTTTNVEGGGVWMAGGGMASDGTYAYFTTGNGAPRQDTNQGDCEARLLSDIQETPTDLEDGFVKLSSAMTGVKYVDDRKPGDNPTSSISQYNTWHCPGNGSCGSCDAAHACSLGGTCIQHSMFWGEERSDGDFGSGGVLLLSSSVGARMIGGGKDGRLYVVNTATMKLAQDFQAFINNYEPANTFQLDTEWYDGPHIHGSPVAWDHDSTYVYVYAWSEKDHLKRFRFNKGTGQFDIDTNSTTLDATATSPFPTAHGDLASPAPGAMPGGMLSLSANGQQVGTGIVWAVVEEPYKFCTKTCQPGGTCSASGSSCCVNSDCVSGQTCNAAWKVVVDQPESSTDDIPGCDIQGGYTPGRLYAFSAEADSQQRLKVLWGDTVAPPATSAVQQAPGTDPVNAYGALGANNYIPAYSKHAPPTIAHGKVLIASANTDSSGMGELRIYGLGSTHPPQKPVGSLNFDDIVVTPPPGATTAQLSTSPWTNDLATAASAGNGTFGLSLDSESTFLGWAATCSQRWDGVWTHPQALGGDFNGDGHSDIALTGAANFTLLKLALSNGNGTYTAQQWTPTNSGFNGWATGPATKLVGNFGDGLGHNDSYADIVLVGDPTFCTIPVAFAKPGATSFTITNNTAGEFTGSCSPANGGWAAAARARLAGDFDGDGRLDIALTAAPNSGWHTIPIAFSNGDGTFNVTNNEVGGLLGTCSGNGASCAQASDCPTGQTCQGGNPAVQLWPIGNSGAPCAQYTACYSQFALWETANDAESPAQPVTPLVGDFNGDGRSDIALVGGAGWLTIPVAFSSGAGTFRITDRCVSPSCDPGNVSVDFGGLASRATGAHRLVGDFNGDGRADVAILDGTNSTSPITVAFSNGDGSFRLTQLATGLGDFYSRIAAGGVPVVGDFDHDGSADIALVGVNSWTDIPVALSNGDGTFRRVTTTAMTTFEQDAASTATCPAGGATYHATVLPGNYK